jgi:hypothetical protein
MLSPAATTGSARIYVPCYPTVEPEAAPLGLTDELHRHGDALCGWLRQEWTTVNSGGAPGFDSAPYQPLWPDGNTKLRPTPVQFSSPLTGSGYNVKYARAAFEADLRRIEDPTVCDRFTGAGCTLMITFPGSPQAGSICCIDCFHNATCT